MSETVPHPPQAAGAAVRGNVRGAFLVIILAVTFAFECYFAVFVASRFQRVFEEMLGPKPMLPTTTEWTLELARFQQSWFLPIILLAVIVLSVLWRQRRAKWARLVCLGGVIGLGGFVAVGAVAMFLPLQQIIQGVNKSASLKPNADAGPKRLDAPPEPP